jgi:hypothetical protein
MTRLTMAKKRLPDTGMGRSTGASSPPRGKGEALDRPELAEIEAAYRKGELDLFVFEDLGRSVRGADAVRLPARR